MAGMPSCFATAVAVGGISCIRPRAPEELTAPMSKLLSCRMMPRENAGSGGVGRVEGRRPAQARQHQAVAAHAAGDEDGGVGHAGI